MHLFQINILILNFWCLLRVSNPRVHLQEDSCIYRCDTAVLYAPV